MDEQMVDIFPPEVILKYIEEYVTTDYRETTDGKWININSEFTSDTKYRMGFNLETNHVNDFKTQTNMSLIQFIQEHESVGYFEAKKILFELSLKMKKGFKRVTRESLREKIIKAVPCAELEDIPEIKQFNKSLSPIGEQALNYLHSRRIDEKHIKKYRLGYNDKKKCCKCHGEGYTDDEDQCSMCNGTGTNYFYSRVIIPSYEDKKLVYLQGRAINDSELRYQNIKAPRLQVVYFYDLLEEGSDIFITEGTVDAMTMYDYNVTSLLNTKISDPQVSKILTKNPKRIIFIPDYDETAAKRERIISAIASNIKKIMRQSDNQVPVGIYHWYKMLDEKGLPIKKDINAANITYVDEKYITIIDPLKLKMMTENKKKTYDE